jgi:hypothetical protein
MGAAQDEMLDVTVAAPAANDLALGRPGVSFAELDGRRGTTALNQAVVAGAAEPIDRDLADRIRSCTQWRSGYVGFLHELTAAGGLSEDAPIKAAQAGLAAVGAGLVFESEVGTSRLEQTLPSFEPSFAYGTGELEGAGSPVTELRVPYRGRELHGASLLEQLERWVEQAVVEPSFAEAMKLVIEHPEWLSLPGRKVVLSGAGAELSPLRALCSWGAEVVAVDLPTSAVWERIAAIARQGAGRLTVPIAAERVPGADLTRTLPELRRWLGGLRDERQLVLGMYAYADGGAHVTVSAAFDALAADMLEQAPETALAFLGTPTDAYLVPEATVSLARDAYAARRLRRVIQAPLQLASGGRLFTPAYREQDSVADVLIKQQGPNYALAKRMQRWRAVVEHRRGRPVSFNVAPASWTRSVTRNRVLASAYASAHRHGIEIFSADTCRTLMAALLVHDLNVRAEPTGHPDRLFSDAAAHGGLWTAAYEPRSVLSFAALTGLPATLLGRGAPR